MPSSACKKKRDALLGVLATACSRTPERGDFFFNHTATPEIYTLSLHDALPISSSRRVSGVSPTPAGWWRPGSVPGRPAAVGGRSEEHTSELQSRRDLVCRLLLEKKKKKQNTISFYKKKK